MIRGTSHIFRFDCSEILDSISDAQSFEVIFEQSNNNNSPIIKKFNVFMNEELTVIGDEGCSIDVNTNEVLVELAPEETILFMEDRKLKVQLKGVTKDTDKTFADYIQYFTVYPMLPAQHSRAIGGGGSGSYALPVASSKTLGGIKIDPTISHLTMNNDLIMMTSDNVSEALEYTPADVLRTVYIGETAPNNEGIQVWVNPTEDDLTGGESDGVAIITSAGGVAIGNNASATSGAALGNGAQATSGFSGGEGAVTDVDAIQLGTGTNNAEKTLQVYDKQLMNENGYIPKERLVYKSQIFSDYLDSSIEYRTHTVSHDVPEGCVVVAQSVPTSSTTNDAAPVMVTVVRGLGLGTTKVYVSKIPGVSLTTQTNYRVRVQIIGC